MSMTHGCPVIKLDRSTSKDVTNGMPPGMALYSGINFGMTKNEKITKTTADIVRAIIG